MKKRLVVPLVGLAISFALPTYAQQKDLADPQTTQKLLALGKADEEAHNKYDAAATAALFTRDAVYSTPGGTVIGRQAIQKWYTDLWQYFHPTNYIAKTDGNAYHLIGTAGNEVWATGETTQTGYDTRNGEPFPVRLVWLCILVREGDDWKLRMVAFGDTPPTVMLLNKLFGPQPAATPSPTARPSTQ
jgi:ketosteroid isomerase-like protein